MICFAGIPPALCCALWGYQKWNEFLKFDAEHSAPKREQVFQKLHVQGQATGETNHTVALEQPHKTESSDVMWHEGATTVPGQA